MSTKTGDDTDTVGSIEKFLQECLEDMEPDYTVKGVGRPRILPAMALWAGLLVCVLRGFGSQLAVWRLLSERQLWFFPRFEVTDQAVYKRLHTAGTKPLERLFDQMQRVGRTIAGCGPGEAGALRQGGCVHRREHTRHRVENPTHSEKGP